MFLQASVILSTIGLMATHSLLILVMMRSIRILLECSLVVIAVVYYRPQRSCGQGYVFTCVCDSAHRGGSPENTPQDQGDTTTPPQTKENPPGTRETPPPSRTRETPPPPGPRRTPHPPGPRRTPSPGTKENPPGPRRTPPPPRTRQTPPSGRRLQHTVNERPVRILLECILVFLLFLSLFFVVVAAAEYDNPAVKS